MSPLEVIRQIEALGGSLHVEGDQLRVRAAAPLPEELMTALTEQKPAVRIALGAPLDATVAGILVDIRPHLSPALRQLSDDRLLALVNWNIITAWDRAVRSASERVPTGGRKGGSR